MAIQFKEIRQYLARNARLSICFEDGYYQDYLMISDIPTEKYKDLYVYGIGMIDVEFSKDIYTSPQNSDDTNSSIKIKECTFEPAIEIVLHKIPRDIKINECVGKRGIQPCAESRTSQSCHLDIGTQ